MHTETRDAMSPLVDFMLQTASRNAELLDYVPQEATLDDLVAWTEDEMLLFADEGQARLSVLLAEALVAMSEEVHAADDRALGGSLTREKAELYVRIAGSLRKASSLTGIARTTLWRAINQEVANAA
jgi:hypothetical protein